jgi:hypothetical protein
MLNLTSRSLHRDAPSISGAQQAELFKMSTLPRRKQASMLSFVTELIKENTGFRLFECVS